MANQMIFGSKRGVQPPATDAVNEAGGRAYRLLPQAALAQYAATGCLSDTYYATASQQLDMLIKLCDAVPARFVAQTAVYCRERGFMKDTPALLCAYLSVYGPEWLEKIFDRVIDNGKMLRTFVQILRSGAVGRKSLGSRPKRLVQRWLAQRSDDQLFRASVGQSPSLGDIVKMAHPKPADASRQALYSYLIGKAVETDKLPPLVREYEAFKRGTTRNVPDVPFQMLTSFELNASRWADIARQASWQTLRMNLNTFTRHGVFEKHANTGDIAKRLRDPVEVRRARVFPYQLLAAYLNMDDTVPAKLRSAIQDALEIATENVPALGGKVYVFPDVSGSMHSPITGERRGSTSRVRCLDVAALVAATVLRANKNAEVIPFSDAVVPARINARDSVVTNAQKLAELPSGGTDCSAPLAELNRRRAEGDVLIYVSDNESWVDTSIALTRSQRGSGTMREWSEFKMRNRDAKLICIDVQPNHTTQAVTRGDILNVGGFSDHVFDVIADFVAGRYGADQWVRKIASIAL